MESSVKSDKNGLSKKNYAGPRLKKVSTAEAIQLLEAHATQGDEGAQKLLHLLSSARRK